LKNHTPKLSPEDAVQVWLRHWQGDYQHVIAASFGVNQGRVCEVLKGYRHPGSEVIARQKRDMH
jgi:hypothetical protein